MNEPTAAPRRVLFFCDTGAARVDLLILADGGCAVEVDGRRVTAAGPGGPSFERVIRRFLQLGRELRSCHGRSADSALCGGLR